MTGIGRRRAAGQRALHPMPVPASLSMTSRTFRAVDRSGRPLGILADVHRCARSRSSWGVLRTGTVRRRRILVPLRQARYEPGRVLLAFDAAALRGAPAVGVPTRGAELAPEDEFALRRHYGI
jgi:hypothetical protein